MVYLEYDIDLHLLQGIVEVIGDDVMKLCSNQFSVNFPSLFYFSPQKVCKFLLSLLHGCNARYLKSLYDIIGLDFSQSFDVDLLLGAFVWRKLTVLHEDF